MPHQHSHKHSPSENHNSHHHGHHHHPPANYNQAFIIGLLLNGGFVVTEFVFGILANSVALIADAGHNLSDVLGLLLAWTASVLARRQPTSRYTYGWRKTSILAAFLNAMFLMVAIGVIIWEAIQRLLHPEDINGIIIIGVAAIGIIINTATALMFVSGRKADMNIRAAFQHMMADALVSVGVVLAGIGILYTNWLWLDPVFSLLISALIFVSTWQLLKDSFNLVIDGVPQHINDNEVRMFLSEIPGVVQVHDLHIWSLSTVETALTAHLVMPKGHPGDEFLNHICEELHEHFDISHCTVQIEVGDSNYPCVLETKCRC